MRRKKLKMNRSTRIKIDKSTKAKKIRKKGQRINKGDRKSKRI